jgi:hypothetical protein
MVAPSGLHVCDRLAEGEYVTNGQRFPDDPVASIEDVRLRLYAADSILRLCAKQRHLPKAMRDRLMMLVGRLTVELDMLGGKIPAKSFEEEVADED